MQHLHGLLTPSPRTAYGIALRAGGTVTLLPNEDVPVTMLIFTMAPRKPIPGRRELRSRQRHCAATLSGLHRTIRSCRRCDRAANDRDEILQRGDSSGRAHVQGA